MKILPYLFSCAVCAGLIALGHAERDSSQRPPPALDNYYEECLHEGCSGEEVEELYASYAEECLHEGCSREEVLELGGNGEGAWQMWLDFNRRKYKVNEKDFENINCQITEVKSKNYGLIVCKKMYQCPDGAFESGWYACGFFFKWTFGF